MTRPLGRLDRIADAEARRLTGMDQFGGCLSVRNMRGGSACSMHAWGIAIDFDPAHDQLRWGRDEGRPTLPDGVTVWRICISVGKYPASA